MATSYWREASTVIIAARCRVRLSSNRTTPDYKILLLKRASKSSFMPDRFVFPGGVINAADESPNWLKLLINVGLDGPTLIGRYQEEVLLGNRSRSLIDPSNNLPKSLSLRIAGIRETFEESGVLLCKKQIDSEVGISEWATFLTGEEILKKRKSVQTDPTEFISMCKYFGCYPDVCAIHRWSNWLTPTNITKRFNTAFFIVALDQQPPALADRTEIDELQWLSPQEVLEMSAHGKIWLAPPQFYEITRLNSLGPLDLLMERIKENNQSSKTIMPLVIAAADGTVSLLPGDERYPEEVDQNTYTPDKKIDITMQAFREQSKQLHRIEQDKNRRYTLITSS